MRRFISIAIIICAAAGVLFVRAGGPVVQEPQGETERKIINLRADLMGPVAAGDTVMFLVGNFAAQHNGAVITCDSAVRYSADRIEFFGNVLINKNTTYIYGDRAEYDGLLNEARVYSDIIKVIDGDATLYTYEFIFNTKDNIGIFRRGGVLFNRENLMEADHGYYYADTKDLVCVKQVQMRNDEYEMTGDSVIYNMNTDHAYYYHNTNIWNSNGDYLYADRGEYRKSDSLYMVTLNGYVLTPKQEMWSDSLDYYRSRERVILRRDIQLDDTEYKTLAFGDYGEYWKNPGNALLTRRPSVINYDPEQPDSIFMRADSIFIFTIYPQAESIVERADSLVADSLLKEVLPDSLAQKPPMERLRPDSLSERTDSLRPRRMARELGRDSVAMERDSVVREDDQAAEPADSIPELTEAQRKAQLKEAARKAVREQRAAIKAEKMKIRDAKLDSIADLRQAKTTARLLAQSAREKRVLTTRRERFASRLQLRRDKALRKGRELPDSSMLMMLDSLLGRNAIVQDSLAREVADTLPAADSLPQPMAVDSLDSLPPVDTMYRLIKAYRNVRTFRTDFQSVCDSLTAISRDSTIHLYIDPVLWNGSNQITSEIMDIYTENQQITRAEFVGEPLMVTQIDTMYYNQVSGKEMTAFFSDNKIYRNDVDGNAQTIYYMQEEGSPQVQGLMVIDSGSITFYINDENQIYRITWRTDPSWNLFPMDKIPADQDLFLKNFKWEGKRRPTQADVFDRRVRPTERQERSQLPHPDFPIAARLEEDKLRFAPWGWSDRDDVVSPDIDEWMRSLGYPTGQPRTE